MAMVLFRIVGGEVKPEIEMPESATILDLKEKIKTILKVGVGRQTLRFNNQLLLNDQTIGNCNFGQSATVVLQVRPLAGQPKFRISVEDNYGDRLVLQVRENISVARLKKKIQKNQGPCSSRDLTLYHLDTEMDNDRPLSAYYVCEDSKVEAICDWGLACRQ